MISAKMLSFPMPSEIKVFECWVIAKKWSGLFDSTR